MRLRPHILVFGLILGVHIGATGCATPGKPAPPPIEEAFAESREAVQLGVEEGFEESESVDEYVVRTRLNPCRCEGPDYEIYVHGRWTRVFMEGDEELMSELREQLVGEDDQLALLTLALRGALSGHESTPRGVEYPVFEAIRVEPVE